MNKTLFLALGVCLAAPALALTADFEDLSFASGNFENGANLSGSFTSRGAAFSNSYNPTWGSWSGFAYSKVQDVTTPGFGNQYAAYDVPTGGRGASGSTNYGVAYNFARGDARITLPAQPLGLYLTNTTYAVLDMLGGSVFSKKFGGANGSDPDFFKLTIFGVNASGQGTGAVDFYLADYRFADNAFDYVVDRWTWVDLSGLGAGTTALEFGLTSSDTGAFGMNTPAYFAVDNVTVVPEPATLAALGLGALAMLRRRRAR